MADTPIAPLSAVDTSSDTTTAQPDFSSQYKLTPGKAGQISTMTPSAGIAMDPESSARIRARLEQMIAEQESPFEKFKADIDTAIAHTGYMPTQRIIENRKMLEAKQADLYNMKLQAENLAAQERANTAWAQRMFPQTGATGAAGAPQAGVAGAPVPGSFEDLTKNLSGPEKAVAMEYFRRGMQKELYGLISASELKRPDLQKNLQFAANLPPDQQRIFMGQAFEKGVGPQSYISGGKEYRYSLPGTMPGQTPFTTSQVPAAAGAPITDAQAWAASQNIPLSPAGGNRTFDQQLDQFLQNPNLAAAPGTSPHEQRRAIDIPAQFRTPEVKNKLEKAGFVAPLANEPWHYELPKRPGVVSAPATSAVGAPGTSVEDIALEQKAKESSIQSFHAPNGIMQDAMKQGIAATKKIQLADQVLNNIKGDNYGPGTELAQSFSRYAQMAGVKLDPSESDTFIRNMKIQNAKKFLSAESARAAMGAQFTAPEADAWLKAFAGIDDPKEYLKNFYQIEKAGALVDKDLQMTLLKNPGKEQEAYIKWQESGAKDRIMRENVDAFKNIKIPKEGAAAPKPKKTVKFSDLQKGQ